MGWVLVGIVVVLALVMLALNRWSKNVEDDLRGGIGWKNTPLFGLTRRRVEQRERDLSGPGNH